MNSSSQTKRTCAKTSPIVVHHLREHNKGDDIVVTLAYQIVGNSVNYGATICRLVEEIREDNRNAPDLSETALDRRPRTRPIVFTRRLRKAHYQTAMRHLMFYPVTVDLSPHLVEMHRCIEEYVNMTDRCLNEDRVFKMLHDSFREEFINLEQRSPSAVFQILARQFQADMVRHVRRCMMDRGTRHVTPARRHIRKSCKGHSRRGAPAAMAAMQTKRSPAARTPARSSCAASKCKSGSCMEAAQAPEVAA